MHLEGREPYRVSHIEEMLAEHSGPAELNLTRHSGGTPLYRRPNHSPANQTHWPAVSPKRHLTKSQTDSAEGCGNERTEGAGEGGRTPAEEEGKEE